MQVNTTDHGFCDTFALPRYVNVSRGWFQLNTLPRYCITNGKCVKRMVPILLTHLPFFHNGSKKCLQTRPTIDYVGLWSQVHHYFSLSVRHISQVRRFDKPPRVVSPCHHCHISKGSPREWATPHQQCHSSRAWAHWGPTKCSNTFHSTIMLHFNTLVAKD